MNKTKCGVESAGDESNFRYGIQGRAPWGGDIEALNDKKWLIKWKSEGREF